MDYEDEIDYDSRIRMKNMFIVIMLVLLLLFFYMAYTQKVEDMKWCEGYVNSTTLRNLTINV